MKKRLIDNLAILLLIVTIIICTHYICSELEQIRWNIEDIEWFIEKIKVAVQGY